MNKIASVLLLLLLSAALAFADDATVLPQGVFRIRAIPSYTTVDQSYDTSGNSFNDLQGSVFTMSGAAELGIIAPITFGLQWAPGYNAVDNFTALPASFSKLSPLLSSFALSLPSAGNLSVIGPADLQIGAKIQVIGDQGFIQNKTFRIALTPGVQVPLDSYNVTTEAQNAVSGSAFRPSSTSEYQSYGLGLKGDVDYQINDMFFINLHGEGLYFLPNDSMSFGTEYIYQSLIKAMGSAAAATSEMNTLFTAGDVPPYVKTTTDFGINTFVEFEPHAKFALSNTMNVSAGLPFSYTYNFANTTSYDGTSIPASTGDPESLLTVGPNVSLFAVLGPLPVEVEVQYVYTLMGKNYASPGNSLELQFKVYGKAY